MKSFDNWNKNKKILDKKDVDDLKIFFNNRQIWWYAVGNNIGLEQNGSGENFERPVLILKKFNKNIFLGIPLTTKNKNLNLPFYLKLKGAKIESIAILSQIRLFSSKRLLREIETIKPELFKQVKEQFKIMGRL